MPKQLMIAAAAALLTAAQPGLAQDHARTAAVASFPEYLDFLRVPNVTSRSTAEIRRNAAWLTEAFTRHGWQSRELPDGETPMVYAELKSPGARKTILFYAHMDGQPVKDAEWAQPSPFEPVLRRCADSKKCETLPLTRLSAAEDGSDWRIFARSAADDKAPIMMMIAAVDALKAMGKLPAINVKMIVDSQEEGGSPTLKGVVARNAALLRADATIILDGPMHPSNKPTIVFGHRGVGYFRLTVFGPKAAAHSGNYGNVLPNPAMRLAQLIASFKDAQGRVIIPGFYDGAAPAYTAAIAKVHIDDDLPGMMTRFGIADVDAVGVNYRDAISKPSLNVVGLGSGTMGLSNATIIPDSAVAAFDIRTVPGIGFERQLGLVRAAVERAGYHLVAKEPTDADRARYPLLAAIDGRGGGTPLFTDPRSPIGVWVRQALGPDAIAIPIMGGTVPSDPLVQGVNAPTFILPLVNADNNQHSRDENMRIGNYIEGVGRLTILLQQRF